MTDRERFLRVMQGEAVEPGVALPEGTWNETPEVWRSQGMPEDFDFHYDRLTIGTGVRFGYDPPWETGAVKDLGDYELVRDEYGIIKRVAKGRTTMPEFVSFPLAEPGDWPKLRERLDPDSPGRFPDDWDQRVRAIKSSGKAVVLGGGHLGGFFSFLRELMGDNVYYLFYDDPKLAHEILDFQVHRFTTIVRKICEDVQLDGIGFWEDMAYRNGPLIGPDLFREFILEPYRKTVQAARECGVQVFDVDSDGDVRKLYPLWLEAGVSVNHPLEVAAGMDVVAVKREYGDRLVVHGGVDKRALAEGPDAIERELDRVWPAYEMGGYLPHVDHAVPTNVTWQNFVYYLKARARRLGKPWD